MKRGAHFSEIVPVRSILCVALVLGGLACTSPNPKSCSLDHHCSDPSLPFCDEDGSIGGTPGTCIAVGCTANKFEECRGNKALTCNARGDDYELVDCPYGCGATGCLPCNTSDCEKHIIPKYLPAVCDQLTALPAVTISQDTMLDTSVASMCSAVVSQPSGPEICVLRGSTVTIENAKTLRVVGSRVLALVADRDFAVHGVLDISGDYYAPNGPGGGILKSGSGAGLAGGGAGYRTVGGSGGADSGTGGSANGGAAGASPALVVSLLGGLQPMVSSSGGPPGAAGGAATLISCRGAVSIDGIIDAGGGGGAGDYIDGPPLRYYSASGGGSGGTVVLQGMTVSVSGGVFANGGGGGGGGAAGGPIQQGLRGSDGLRSTSVAPGGPAQSGAAAGGYGGALFPAANGERPSGTSCGNGCGAGGGSAGFLLTYSPAGRTPALGTAVVSPGFEQIGRAHV